MKRVIIESPYSGDRARNVTYAKLAMLDCLHRGESPLISHLLYTQVLDDDDPKDRAMGIEAGLTWYPSAELCVVYADHGVSKGMLMGIRRAQERGVPVEFRWLDPDKSSEQKI